MNAAQTAALLGRAEPTSTGWRCRCPAHLDRSASLTIIDTPDGRRKAQCASGCCQASIINFIKLAAQSNAEWIAEYEAAERIYWPARPQQEENTHA